MGVGCYYTHSETKTRAAWIDLQPSQDANEDFEGNDYTPGALPEATEFVNYTIEQGNTENAKVIFNFSNDADARYGYTEADVQADVEVGVVSTYVSNGSVVVELNNRYDPQPLYTLPEQIEIPISIDFYDVLGFNIQHTENI